MRVDNDRSSIFGVKYPFDVLFKLDMDHSKTRERRRDVVGTFFLVVFTWQDLCRIETQFVFGEVK